MHTHLWARSHYVAHTMAAGEPLSTTLSTGMDSTGSVAFPLTARRLFPWKPLPRSLKAHAPEISGGTTKPLRHVHGFQVGFDKTAIRSIISQR